jgi:hypothetical protein|tara:strand:- start:200 stop:328 length:129 start_codon:yes stop_codon:yes gene_type:complete
MMVRLVYIIIPGHVWVDVDIDVPEANERPSNLVTDHEEVEFA